MEPIRILGIAPYEGIAHLMRQAAEKRHDISLTVYVGDLSDGVDLATAHADADRFDVILSRGGTAELIRQHTTLPVIDIPLSVYDILRSIKLAENHNCKYAVIGFPAITRNAAFLCEVLRYDVDIYTIHNLQEAHRVLRTLESTGCQMVLCDVVTNALAHEYGLPAVLITSGLESVEDALCTAMQEGLAHRHAVMQTDFFRDVIHAMPHDTLVCDGSGRELFSSFSSALPDAVQAKAHALATAQDDQPHRNSMETDCARYILQTTPVRLNEEICHVVTITEQPLPFSLKRNGITYSDRQEAVDTFFDSFYGITQSFSSTNLSLEQYLQSNQPLLIYGEPGTAKPQMARMLYAKGPLSNAPLITVDCALLMRNGWKYLMENDRSPLIGHGCTLKFDHVDSLSDEQFNELFSTIRALHTAQQNRLFFSASCDAAGTMHPHYPRLIDMLDALTLFMPPLRSHLQDISRLSSLYISTLNMRNARSVLGFEPGAEIRMTEYTWQGNYDQFCRVLNELVLKTTTPYISEEAVRLILKRECALYPAVVPASLQTMPADMTIEQLETLALQQALQIEKGNQKRAAERLGISRTTLWRMLQKIEKSPTKPEQKAKP